MFRASLERVMRSIKAESTGVEQTGLCHFLRIPLEIRDSIYRMLLTTPYCTQLAWPGKPKFHIYTDILLANKRIFIEAARVILEENELVILKVTGLSRPLDSSIPRFAFLSADEVVNPVLRIEVKIAGDRIYKNDSYTLTTTPDGLQPIISALWRLSYADQVPSDFSVSLTFNVRASVRLEALTILVLKPWERLHGIKALVLPGNIGDSMLRHLEESMLEGPCLKEVALGLKQYYSMGQQNLAQKNFMAANWWWTLYEDYCMHLGALRLKPPVAQKSNDYNNNLWTEVCIQSTRMYYQGKLGKLVILLRRSMYREAILSVLQARHARTHAFPINGFSTISPILKAKFSTCEAFAHIALNAAEVRIDRLKTAAAHLCSSSHYNNLDVSAVSENLKMSIYTELMKQGSQYRFKFMVYLEKLEDERRIDGQAGAESRSFWEWLDLPED